MFGFDVYELHIIPRNGDSNLFNNCHLTYISTESSIEEAVNKVMDGWLSLVFDQSFLIIDSDNAVQIATILRGPASEMIVTHLRPVPNVEVFRLKIMESILYGATAFTRIRLPEGEATAVIKSMPRNSS